MKCTFLFFKINCKFNRLIKINMNKEIEVIRYSDGCYERGHAI